MIHVKKAFDVISDAMKADPDYAWSFHCALAMMAYDAGAPHKEANIRASDLMLKLFDVDTSKSPYYLFKEEV